MFYCKTHNIIGWNTSYKHHMNCSVKDMGYFSVMYPTVELIDNDLDQNIKKFFQQGVLAENMELDLNGRSAEDLIYIYNML